METSISLQELQKHNKVDDAWIVISGKVLLLKVLLTINLFYCKMLIFAYGRSKQSNCMPVSFSKRQINVLTVPEWGFFCLVSDRGLQQCTQYAVLYVREQSRAFFETLDRSIVFLSKTRRVFLPAVFSDVTQRYPSPNKRCVMTLLIVGKFKLTPEGDQCGQLLPNYIEKLLTMI